LNDLLAYFEQAVFDKFGAVISEFHLHHVRSVIRAPEIAIFFERDAVGLSVKFELGITPWVEFANILRSEDGTIVSRQRCALKFLLSEVAPTEQPIYMPLEKVDDPKLGIILEQLARQVRRHGADVLRGDFRIFPMCLQRAEKNQ
jgi:hypothetical protein